jgi:putative protease
VPQLGGLVIPSLEGDFSLGAANALAASLLLAGSSSIGGGSADSGRAQLSRLAPTYDLNAAQMCGLARALGPEGAGLVEAVVHQHLPIFHTEHCVFCRFLSDGNSYRDCGHPCETASMHLRDSGGQDHLVLADMGCRNTVFNAQAQSALWHLPELVRAGVRHLRVELVDEPAQFVGPLLGAYRDVLTGSRPPGDAWSWLGTLPDANGRAHGVSSGSLAVPSANAAPRVLKTTAAQAKAAQAQGGRVGARR